MNITIETSGINETVKSLTGKLNKRKIKYLCKSACYQGLQTADMWYTLRDENEDNPVLNVEPQDMGAKLVASGKGLYFIEFGTGVTATTDEGSQFGFTPWSWSKTQGTGFGAKHGWWVFRGKNGEWQYRTGTIPCLGMYHAKKTIQEYIRNKAEEILSR